MFVYIKDFRMFYELDAFRYDKEKEEVLLTICGFRMEIVLKNIGVGAWLRIRRSLLHDYYFDISEYNWDIHML